MHTIRKQWGGQYEYKYCFRHRLERNARSCFGKYQRSAVYRDVGVNLNWRTSILYSCSWFE